MIEFKDWISSSIAFGAFIASSAAFLFAYRTWRYQKLFHDGKVVIPVTPESPWPDIHVPGEMYRLCGQDWQIFLYTGVIKEIHPGEMRGIVINLADSKGREERIPFYNLTPDSLSIGDRVSTAYFSDRAVRWAMRRLDIGGEQRFLLYDHERGKDFYLPEALANIRGLRFMSLGLPIGLVSLVVTLYVLSNVGLLAAIGVMVALFGPIACWNWQVQRRMETFGKSPQYMRILELAKRPQPI